MTSPTPTDTAPGAVELKPIAMLLYCPQCGKQHVDEPDERTPDWTNPPHRSHLCHDCGCIWRPADVPTNGVASIETCGKADTWTSARGNAERVRTHPSVATGEIVERLRKLAEQRADGTDFHNGRQLTADDTMYAAAATLIEQQAATIAELREWALDKSSTHHRLAHENAHLRTEHIASSTAYRELAQEIENRTTLNRSKGS